MTQLSISASTIYLAWLYVLSLFELVTILLLFVKGLFVYIKGQIEVIFTPLAIMSTYKASLLNNSNTIGEVVKIVLTATFFLLSSFSPLMMFLTSFSLRKCEMWTTNKH